MNNYGKELILDLHGCEPRMFTRAHISNYFIELCDLIDMKREKLVWWDDLYTKKSEREIEPHLKGTSAVQFIKTSNITIHTLDILRQVYINIFSCKDFDVRRARDFTQYWFKGEIVKTLTVSRL